MKNITTFITALILLIAMIQAQNHQDYKMFRDNNSFKQQLMNGQDFSTIHYTTQENQNYIYKETYGTMDFGDPPEWNWTQQFGGSGSDYGRDIIADEDGNFYVTGSFSGEISIGENTYTSIGKWDAFVAKFNSDNELVWLKQFPASPMESIETYGMCLNHSGNVFVTGYYTGDVTIGSYELPGNSAIKNLFYAGIDPDGSVLIANDFGTYHGTYIGLKIETDTEGNVYIIGSQSESTYYKSIILKFDNEGNNLWFEYSMATFYDIEVFGSSMYFAGTVNTPVYIGEFYFDPVSYMDAFIAKADLDLNFEWAYMAGHIGTTGHSYAKGIFVNQNEEIFMTGYFYTNLIFGDVELEGRNGFITKSTASGDLLWSKHVAADPNAGLTPSDISGDDQQVFVCTNNSFANTIGCFSASAGSLEYFEYLDSSPSAMHYDQVNSKIHITGENEQFIFLLKLTDQLTIQNFLQFEGNSAFGHLLGMKVDQYGCFYTYSYVSNEQDFFGQGVEKGLLVCKHDPSGNIIWINHLPDEIEYPGTGSYLEVDTLNEFVYLTGTFYEPLTIPGITTLSPGQYGSIFVIKYDFDGNYQWSLQEDFDGGDLCLCPDYSGNILISGVFNTEIVICNTVLTSAGNDDVFIAKYNADGSPQWAKRAGGEGIEYLGLISIDGNDNVYLTGEFTSVNVTVDDYSLTLEEGDGNVLFAKLDPNGNVLWATSKANSTVYDGSSWPTGIETDAAGYSYIKGWHGDQTYFDNILLTSPYGIGYSYFIAKFDPDGNTLWANSINKHWYGFDYNQMSIDPYGNVYFGAQLRDTIHFGDDYVTTNVGRCDLFVAKYRTNGELDWVKIIRSSIGYNWISSVAVYDTNSIYLGGYFNVQIYTDDFDLTANNRHGFVALIGEDVSGFEEIYTRQDDFMNIYPNPADGLLFLAFENTEIPEIDLEIIDITGKLILKEILNTTSINQIDVSGLPKGIYLIKAQSGTSIWVEKLIIQ